MNPNVSGSTKISETQGLSVLTWTWVNINHNNLSKVRINLLCFKISHATWFKTPGAYRGEQSLSKISKKASLGPMWQIQSWMSTIPWSKGHYCSPYLSWRDGDRKCQGEVGTGICLFKNDQWNISKPNSSAKNR